MAEKPNLSLEVQARVESEHERLYERYQPVSLPEVNRKNPVLKTATVKLDLTRPVQRTISRCSRQISGVAFSGN